MQIYLNYKVNIVSYIGPLILTNFEENWFHHSNIHWSVKYYIKKVHYINQKFTTKKNTVIC